MLKFLLIKICLACLIIAALSEEIIPMNLPIHDITTISRNSRDDISNYDLMQEAFIQNRVVTCNDTQACENGGSCLNQACLCLPGTSGSFCQIVDDCQNEKLCKKDRYTSCEYSVEEQKAICHCHVMEYRFDDASKTCKSCLCTRTFSQELNSFSYCEYKQGQQICTCTEGFAPKVEHDVDEWKVVCKKCDCGPNTRWCEFDSAGNQICTCKDGYSQDSYYYPACKKCDCGPNGNCSLIRPKMCSCDPGYEEYNGKCEECSCGKYGKCIFDPNVKQIGCECLTDYAEKSGKCQKCYCGENSNCTFTGNTKICECLEGFENVNGFCTDINECEKHSPCNITTKCVNTLGSYKCICDKGFKRNRETLLCEDIDECQFSITCSQPNTKCINTVGSFKCVCESGFVARGGSDSNTLCEESSFKKIETAFAMILIASIVISSYIIFNQKHHLRFRRSTYS